MPYSKKKKPTIARDMKKTIARDMSKKRTVARDMSKKRTVARDMSPTKPAVLKAMEKKTIAMMKKLSAGEKRALLAKIRKG